MRSILYVGLGLLFAIASGCRHDEADDPGPDLGSPDMASAAMETTIRQLNAGASAVQPGTKVRLHGVVISPMTWVDPSDNPAGSSDFCDYKLAVMHADGTAPTLQDGMSIFIGLKTQFMAGMPAYTACDELGKKNQVVVAMKALKMGDLVQIDGVFDAKGLGGSRRIDVFAGQVLGMGPAPILPDAVPVADPAMFAPGSPLPRAFLDAHAVLVQLSGIQVTAHVGMYQDFTVNTTNMGGASISTNYVHVLDAAYKAPAVGMPLTSVTGIVWSDYSGQIWPRRTSDIK